MTEREMAKAFSTTALDVSVALQRALPRGKGAVLRALGRLTVPPGRRYLITRHGAKLVMSPDSLDVYATMRAEGNAWDYDDFAVCHGCTLDGGVYYDVGANVGYFAIEMAVLTGQAVTVVAFEPQRPLFEAIEATIALNEVGGTVRVLDVLVGDREGVADLFLSAATIHASAVDDSGRNPQSVKRVEMITLDGLIARGAPPPTMIKMDIEGSEHLALRGAREVLREARPHIFIEYNRDADPDGRVWAEIESLMADAGCYDLYFSPHSTLRSSYPARLVPFGSADDRRLADNLMLRNRERPVRNEAIFCSRPAAS